MSKFGITDRKEFKALVDARMDALFRALNGDLLSNKEDLVRDALRAKGFENNSEEILDDISKRENVLTDAVSEHLDNAKERLDIEMAEATEALDKELRELTENYPKKKKELEFRKLTVREDVTNKHKNVEETIAAEKFPDQVQAIAKLKLELEAVRNIENIVDKDVREKLAILRKFKYRMENAIRDKGNRIKEELVMCETMEAAKELLGQLPTNETLITACQNANGINDIISTLTPKLALPMAEATTEAIKAAPSKADLNKEPEHELEIKAEKVDVEEIKEEILDEAEDNAVELEEQEEQVAGE
jgi:hypothetical protein